MDAGAHRYGKRIKNSGETNKLNYINAPEKKPGMGISTAVWPTVKHRTSAKHFNHSVKRYSIIPQHRESRLMFLKFEPYYIVILGLLNKLQTFKYIWDAVLKKIFNTVLNHS